MATKVGVLESLLVIVSSSVYPIKKRCERIIGSMFIVKWNIINRTFILTEETLIHCDGRNCVQNLNFGVSYALSG